MGEGRDKDNGRRSNRGVDHVACGGIAYCGGLARWRLYASRGASLDDECFQKFREPPTLQENLGAMVMHLLRSSLTTTRNFSP